MKSKAAKKAFSPVTVTIEHLGAQGDGIARDEDGKKYYVPLTLPGEEAEIRPLQKRGDGFSAKLLQLRKPSPERISPACRHFGRCGGCSLQHADERSLARFKQEQLSATLAHRGFRDLAIGETLSTGAGKRRRARFAAVRTKDRMILGFNERLNKTVLDLEECPLMTPALEAVLPPLRGLLQSLPSLGKAADIQITEAETGLEVVFYPAKEADPALKEREALLEFAEQQDIARIAWQSGGFLEPIAARRPVRVNFADVPVELPAGSFLQPSRTGEHHLAKLVQDGVGTAKRIADLYCGCGSLTFPAAKLPHNPVIHAVDGSEAQIGALRKAAHGMRITAEIRDLARDPLTSSELNRYDAVVFDPPRAGAREQAEELAGSTVKKLVAVSCNPGTMARDLRILVDSGYRITRMVPVDQFTWSPHLEAVAWLERD
ncbi:class I SAM-dependent RNA methyltransferase [Aestuariispira insulae]|uniref:23S rRNA m(5)U-1939 methyltransferase n=1 Tax=Aestuariispira insulae TaxID=1461337 RepID=A0A3D9HK08_9PROT|nr:TRAM domain-containing protein [Aestuariispira insulae]RED49839.1 23S rRNA m(5)U-1939 methyltransferase [Aestuariispira insulae]